MEKPKEQRRRRATVIENAGHVVVSADGRIRYASEESALWLKQFFANGQPESFLPKRVLSWLKASDTAHRVPSLSAKRNGVVLFVSVLRPRAADSVVLLMERYAGTRRAGIAARHKKVSKRQMDVWHGLWLGKTNGGIAEMLGIAESTVARHLEKLYEKLGVESRMAAANMYPAEAEALATG